MASDLSLFIDAVHDPISVALLAEEFTDNSFTLVKSYLPSSRLPALAEASKVTVCGLGPDIDNLSRKASQKWTAPIQVAYQKVLAKPEDYAETDAEVDLVEQIIQKVLKSLAEGDDFTWISSQVMKDENGLPFSYTELRETALFQAINTITITAEKQAP